MNRTAYQNLLTSAVYRYIESSAFIGYIYPGQFYDFTASTDTYTEVTGDNSYRWMSSLADVCKAIPGITFSKLSPAKEGGRCNRHMFTTLFSLALEWHSTASADPIAVYVAKAMETDRRIALSELSRYFGGGSNLMYLVKETKLTLQDIPSLTRGDYKALSSMMAKEGLKTMRSVHERVISMAIPSV
jgi:hypothetical protein